MTYSSFLLVFDRIRTEVDQALPVQPKIPDGNKEENEEKEKSRMIPNGFIMTKKPLHPQTQRAIAIARHKLKKR